MRSGHLGRLAVLVSAVLVTGACASTGGTGGTGAATAEGTAGGTAAAPVPAAGAVPQAAPADDIEPTSPVAVPQSPVRRPAGDEPVVVPPPKVSDYSYVFPVKGCKAKYARKLLVTPKTTIWANRGCAFVSPVNGTVDEVAADDTWNPDLDLGPTREGRFVSVIGEDGVRYLGGHLDSVAEDLKPGAKVRAGQTLGEIGNSGNSRDTATNLYFSISWKADPSLWWVRRGMVKPWDYLDAWRDGNRTLSPRQETLDLRRELGAKPACKILCASKPPVTAPAPPPAPSPTPTKKKPQRPVQPRPSVLEPIGG
ncbi:hypothetical protein Misp01_37870 [Microtetraspora sp. NBRC 13810]|uniref:M23 family metallopeptidase n=1 Tax=Microtetraspora sp. NBRC 13810 TaxID=3030990 RepID=UPI0024A52C88|nr:M23 family metallopeptidase [Microtetraspora sp. NBRC 13810]GLW08657.1 hypothetical protein Misp01_37870 [Microtetraspora sp. NBRC 13810]